ncbi:MAG: hypothetical protein H6720_27750 [Sandaracinus sp.]|nr:hypothetical protein [Myxococcales bacterium]MCB9604135.1 hypothetical protein [Sandaracinus sp.]
MRRALLAALFACLACGDDGAPSSPDGGGCTRDEDCSDGVFCGGIERCVEGACVAGAIPRASSATGAPRDAWCRRSFRV